MYTRIFLFNKFTYFFLNKKIYINIAYHYDVKEDNCIVISKHVLSHHWPHYSKTTVGALLLCQRWKKNSTSTVETLVVEPMTCCHQLQPLANVGPTINCYLGVSQLKGDVTHLFCHCLLCHGMSFIKSIIRNARDNKCYCRALGENLLTLSFEGVSGTKIYFGISLLRRRPFRFTPDTERLTVGRTCGSFVYVQNLATCLSW